MNCNKIITDKNCNTIITNEEFSNLFIYIYILLLNNNDGTTQSLTIIRENEDDEIKFTIGLDGFYTLCKLKILRNDLSKELFPTFLTLEEKFNLMDSEKLSEFINKGLVFYSNGKYYFKKPKEHLNEANEITILELICLNYTITNIDITYYYYFLTCRLMSCYIKLAQKILDERSGIRCGLKVDQNDIYKRDLVWTALNTIIYMAEKDQFEEASRLLESVIGCNGLCPDDLRFNCGCNK